MAYRHTRLLTFLVCASLFLQEAVIALPNEELLSSRDDQQPNNRNQAQFSSSQDMLNPDASQLSLSARHTRLKVVGAGFATLSAGVTLYYLSHYFGAKNESSYNDFQEAPGFWFGYTAGFSSAAAITHLALGKFSLAQNLVKKGQQLTFGSLQYLRKTFWDEPKKTSPLSF